MTQLWSHEQTCTPYSTERDHLKNNNNTSWWDKAKIAVRWVRELCKFPRFGCPPLSVELMLVAHTIAPAFCLSKGKERADGRK